MIVYKASKSEFLHDAANGIEDVVRDKVSDTLGINVQVGSSEYNSWKNSLGNAMYHVMDTNDIPADAVVAIEYSIPRTKNRIDFLISGFDENHKERLVVIELKQWADVGITEKDGIVETRFQHGYKETNHPSYQSWSYCSLLNNFNEFVYSNHISLHPCTYLHNLSDPQVITHDFYAEYVQKAPAFFKGEKDKLQTFIAKYVKYGDTKDTLYKIDNGNVRPSKDLADSLVSMMKNNQEFVLIDDQKLIYENALSLARKNHPDQKQVMIIEGGPGTGKSVVAINLLVAINKLGLLAHYVTKNAAPRGVFESKLTGSMRKSQIANLFQGSGAYVAAELNEVDTLIIDEAHRLNEKSGIYRNLGENQIKELICAANVSIFFVDEDQKVTWHDIGDVDEITKWANFYGAKVHYAKLESQFRCNGSDGYLAWVDNTLQMHETANKTLEGINYDFQVFDSPAELKSAILEKNVGTNKARLLAGYCWNWVSKRNKLAYDIEFPEHDFAMQWNLTEDGNTYMIAPNSVDQVGCIHTSQGLDLEYVGVIIGPDLIIRDNKVITQPSERAKTDKSLNGYKTDLKNSVEGTEEKADKLIRNTYRALMTRGMRGCYVYCTDEETREYFKNRLHQ